MQIKSIVLFLAFVLVFVFSSDVYAQGRDETGVNSYSNSTSDQVEIKEVQTQGADVRVQAQQQERAKVQDQLKRDDDEPVLYQEQNQERSRIQINLEESGERAQNAEQLKEMVETRRLELASEAMEYRGVSEEVVQNQNRIREAVHALLASEDLVGGIGPRVSELAQEINERVQTTVQAEESIQKRGGVARFFFGGDIENAQALQEERDRIREYAEEMMGLVENCNDCSADVRAIVQEKVQAIQEEQERLGQVADKEINTRGLFRFLFGWL